MTLALYGLLQEYAATRDQIFGSPVNPTMTFASFVLLSSFATIHHWTILQLDIKNAFLHCDIDEELYMEQPPGLIAQGESSNMVYRIDMSLYDLKQVIF